MHSFPTPQDLPLIFKIAPKVRRRKHARYRVALALGALFDKRFATTPEHRHKACAILGDYMNGADSELKNLIEATLMLIEPTLALTDG